jgi:hypothetical protein
MRELDHTIRLRLCVVGILLTVAIVGNFEVSWTAAAVKWVDFEPRICDLEHGAGGSALL